MKQTLAEIISIGDEILYGQTLDTNSHWISGALDQIGIKVIRKSTVPDIEAEILTSFQEAEKRADVILITMQCWGAPWRCFSGPCSRESARPCLLAAHPACSPQAY